MNEPGTAPPCRYLVAAADHGPTAADLIGRVFARDEPLAKTVGQTLPEFTSMLGVLLPAALPQRLSIAAVSNDAMLGIALTTAFTFTPPPGTEDASPNYPPIGALIAELERDYERENTDRLGSCAHLHMLAVDTAARGRGIAQALVEATADAARSNGYETILSDATNPISRSVFARQGFATINHVRYDRFEYAGGKPFAALAHLGGIHLMEKRL